MNQIQLKLKYKSPQNLERKKVTKKLVALVVYNLQANHMPYYWGESVLGIFFLTVIALIQSNLIIKLMH